MPSTSDLYIQLNQKNYILVDIDRVTAQSFTYIQYIQLSNTKKKIKKKYKFDSINRSYQQGNTASGQFR